MTLDELGEFGMVRMDDTEIEGFLRVGRVAVLGLAAEGVPYLLPLSYGYDGERTLYFTYVVGAKSRKDELTARTERASALVYSAESKYNWESVTMTGTLAELPESEWADHEEAIAGAWRPDLFEQASGVRDVRVYTFHVDEWTGIKHTGLPPGFADTREP
jgi:nitroimidazol reductase NimA-like FMN-containing flavoprotein (pyridoxamine 5'-phosphate oxidase superfamily)